MKKTLSLNNDIDMVEWKTVWTSSELRIAALSDSASESDIPHLVEHASPAHYCFVCRVRNSAVKKFEREKEKHPAKDDERLGRAIEQETALLKQCCARK